MVKLVLGWIFDRQVSLSAGSAQLTQVQHLSDRHNPFNNGGFTSTNHQQMNIYIVI